MSHSGAFFFIRSGSWLTAAEISADGTLIDRHGVELEPISLEDEVLTVRAVASATILAGKRTRLDVVNVAGLTLPTEIGKGRNTLRRIIELRAGTKAASVIAAYETRYSDEIAAAA